MFCARCGAPCREDEVFCAHCGAALLVEGGRVAEPVTAPPAPAAEKPAEGTSAVPAGQHRRLSRRGRFLLGGVCGALVVALAAFAWLNRPTDGFRARPPALLSAWVGGEQGSECFYYDGELVVGAEEGLIGLSTFLDGRSCLAMDTDGALAAVVTTEGVVELDLPEGTLTTGDAAADGSVLYRALGDGTLWRCPLPSGAPELVAEGCSVEQLRVSPSGDTAAYYDGNARLWYLARANGAPETLPLPDGAVIYTLSDDGRYVYYGVGAVDDTTPSTSSIYCWDGAASHLVGYTDAIGPLTNRTGDQLLMVGDSTTCLVEGSKSWTYPNVLYPTFLLQGQGNQSGFYRYWTGVTVLDCADLTEGYFVASGGEALYRLEKGVLTPVQEDLLIGNMLTDATGQVLWYVQEGGLWQFRKGRSTLRWDDAGEMISPLGVSPDGDIVVCENDAGLWRLRAGGEPELLSEHASGVYPYWKGFYYREDTALWYAPWDGEPEELEELEGARSIGTSSAMQVELENGSIWHVIEGMEPIQVTNTRADGG